MDHLLNFLLEYDYNIRLDPNLKEGLIRETLVSFILLHTHLVSEKF